MEPLTDFYLAFTDDSLTFNRPFKIEIRSTQIDHSDFGKGLKVLGKVLADRLTDQAIVYAGEFENNSGNIKLLNYKHMNSILLS